MNLMTLIPTKTNCGYSRVSNSISFRISSINFLKMAGHVAMVLSTYTANRLWSDSLLI